MASLSDPHLTKLNNYGGYATNFSSRIYTEALQKRVNPGLLKDVKREKNLSITMRDYPAPPPMKTGLEGCPSGAIPVMRSGYTTTKPLHTPTVLQVLDGVRAQNVTTDKVDCAAGLSSEMADSFISAQRKPTNKFIYEDPPGSRDTGFSQSENAFNPVTCKQLNPSMDQTAENLRGRMNIASVTQTDFQPFMILSGKESSAPLSLTATRDGTGFVNAKELKPCFMPQKTVKDVDPCFKYDRFMTMYTKDYYPKISGQCAINGMRIVGKLPQTAYSVQSEFDLCHRCPISPYLTETMERYVSPVKEGNARDGHLRGAVFPPWNSPYVYNNFKKDYQLIDKCRDETFTRAEGPTEPTRDDPMKRLVLGHRVLVNKNFRPHPVEETPWTEVQTEPNLNFNSTNPII